MDKKLIDDISRSIAKSEADFDSAFDNIMRHEAQRERAFLDTPQQLEEINKRLDAEAAARQESEKRAEKEYKSNRRLQIIGIIIGALTLLATLLGILAPICL